MSLPLPDDLRAEAAWTEVREDGVPELVLETRRGEIVVELSPQAAGELRREFVDGPTFRHDLEADDA